MLKKIILGIVGVLAAVIVVILVIAATKSDDFRVERHTSIHAAPSALFPIVNDLHRFPDWSPWQRLDPHMTTSFEGPAAGPGASYAWRGNDDVGEGRMTITRSQPDSIVEIRLEFLKPWQATNMVEWRIEPEGDGSRVSWIMTGKSAFMMKVITVFMDMDSMVGADFEKGLAQLKQIGESTHG